MNKQVYSLPLDLIEVGERLRPVDPDYVSLIAASMAERGQDTPIVVGAAGTDGKHKLIAGGHRVEAARALGWPRIDALISDASELQAKLQEIDENLIRRELSALDRAVFLAERKAIYEALHPEARQGGARRGIKTTSLSFWSEAFSKATAEKLGVDRRTIERAVKRAELAKNPELHRLLGKHPVADSGAELDKLLAEPPERRLQIAQALTRAENPARNVAEALVEISGPPARTGAGETQRQLNALLSAWRKAGAAARRQFVEFLEEEGAIDAGGGKPRGRK